MIGLNLQQRQHASSQIRVPVMTGSILIRIGIKKLTPVTILRHLPNHKMNALLAPIESWAARQIFAGRIEFQLAVSEFGQDWLVVALLQEFSHNFSFYLGEVGDSGIHGVPELSVGVQSCMLAQKFIVAILSAVQPTHTEYGSMLYFGVQSKPVSLRLGNMLPIRIHPIRDNIMLSSGPLTKAILNAKTIVIRRHACQLECLRKR